MVSRETETHLKARDNYHVSTFPDRDVTIYIYYIKAKTLTNKYLKNWEVTEEESFLNELLQSEYHPQLQQL